MLIDRIRDLLEKYKEVLNKLPKDLTPLMIPHKEVVEAAIKPGLLSVTWVSTNIEDCNDRIFF